MTSLKVCLTADRKIQFIYVDEETNEIINTFTLSILEWKRIVFEVEAVIKDLMT